MHLGESVISLNKHYDINEDDVIDIADASILLNSDLYEKKYSCSGYVLYQKY